MISRMNLIVSTTLTSADFALNCTMCPEDNGSLAAYVGVFVLSYPCSTVRSITLIIVRPAIERGYRFVKECGCDMCHFMVLVVSTKTHYFLKVAKPFEDLVNLDNI